MNFLQGLLAGGSMNVMGLIVFVLVTWFSGSYLKFMEKWRPLIIVVGALIWFLIIVIQKMVAKKSAAAIEDRLRAQAQDQIAAVRPDRKPQVQALEKQLTEAIAALKTSKMGAGALYALPWYIIIGPPGSGKSTALQESGLNFPYMSQGRKGIRGVGGTRNCDWWFTDQGILLDTAGRYTTELEDRDEWLSFLDMLKKCRKRKPINGAIVCVSIADLVQCTDEEREAHVKNIKDRIDELTKRLEQVFPVYLLFTKCDLLNGFVDFFEDFGKNDRSQVWGFTLPHGGEKVESYQPIFEEEVRKLYSQLSAQRILALSTERPMDKKRRIYGFPIQFSMAHRKLADFVGELFRPNPFQESSTLRGVYFTSGTQEGTPIDQLVAAMGSAFGLQEDAAGLISQAVDRKSYFINTLFSKIIFGDQNLARSSTKVARRRRVLRTAMAIGSVVALLGFSISLGIAFVGNLHLMRSVGATAKKLQDAGKSSPQDLAGNLQALEDLRVRIDELDRYTREELPMSLRWGLYRGEEVYLGQKDPVTGQKGKTGIRKVYIDSINSLFLKPNGENLLKEMKQRVADTNKTRKDFDKLYDLVLVYKMLARKEEPNKNLMTLVLTEDDRWLKALGPGATSLSPDLKKMAEKQMGFFIDQAVAGMKWPDIPLPVTEYDAISMAKIVEELAGGPWVTESFRDMIRLAGERYPKVSHETLIKARGKELFACPEDKYVPGYYTQRAYNEYMQSAIQETSENLSKKLAKLEREKSADEISKQFRTMYKSEYTLAWQTFLENVELKNFDNLRDATNKLKVLTATDSAYRDLFKGIWEGRRLDLGGGEVINDTKDDRKWVDDALKALEELQRGLDKIQSTSPPGDRFVSMTEAALKELSYLFSNAKTNIENSVKQADPALSSSAARFLTRSLMSTIEALVTEAQAEAEALWKKSVYEGYVKKLAGKFPLVTDAGEEIPMKVFSEAFNPKSGTFWKTTETLARLARGFSFEDRRLVRFSTDYDECVKKAEQFRDALYPTKDSEQIQLTLDLTLQQRSAVVDITVYVGEKKFSASENMDRRGTLIWSEAAPRGAKVEVHHDDNQHTPLDKFAGMDWGILRLFAEGKLAAKGEKTFECTWEFNVTVSGAPAKRKADCMLEMKDKVNPFVANFFVFKCPEKLGP